MSDCYPQWINWILKDADVRAVALLKASLFQYIFTRYMHPRKGRVGLKVIL